MEYVTLAAEKRAFDTGVDAWERIPIAAQAEVIKRWSDGDYILTLVQIGPEPPARTRFSRTLASTILDDLRAYWVTRYLRMHYAFFDKEEEYAVAERAADILGQLIQNEDYSTAAANLDEWFDLSDEVILDGFVLFRMKWFWAMVKDAIERSVDAFLLEKEYDEFVRLLRYFVVLQEPRTSLVHVLPGSKQGIRIIDESGQRTYHDYVNQQPFDFEDLIVSALISMAPRKILIHLGSDHRISKTLQAIFEQRVVFCSGCPRCDGGSYRPKW